jgi:thioredoxin-like negative regulator of GroEL
MTPSARSGSYQREVPKREKSVLFAFFHWGEDLSKQMHVLETVCERYRDALEICLLENESFQAFREAFGIEGTPTFLLFHSGRERSRMLGQFDEETLNAFLRRSLPHLRDDSPQGESLDHPATYKNGSGGFRWRGGDER